MYTEFDIVPEKMKKKFWKKYEKYHILFEEMDNCIRYIKMWIAFSKNEFRHLELRSFFYWMNNDAIMPLLAINTIKILKHTETYFDQITNKIFSSDTQRQKLIENSKIAFPMGELRRIVSPLLPHRNKRYAHLVNYNLAAVSVNLKDLIVSLYNLKRSLIYIKSYFLYPPTEKCLWSLGFVEKDNDEEIERIFEDDGVIKDFYKILEKMKSV